MQGEEEEEQRVERYNHMARADELLKRGLVSAAINALSEVQKPDDTILLRLVELHLKLMDLSQAMRVLKRVCDKSSLEETEQRISRMRIQPNSTQWDTIVTTHLESIKSLDQPSWRILHGNLYSLAYNYMVRGWDHCDFFYRRFSAEVNAFVLDTILPRFVPDRSRADVPMLQQIVKEAVVCHQRFSHRLVAIFQYLDRYHLRTRGLPKLNQVCHSNLLTAYFEKAILPILMAIWVMSYNVDPPVLDGPLGTLFTEYWEQSPQNLGVVKSKVTKRQSIIGLKKYFPNELVKLVLDFAI